MPDEPKSYSRIMLRESVYRGVPGFTVTASRERGFPPCRVFTPRRVQAEKIRAAYRDENSGKLDRQACQKRISEILLKAKVQAPNYRYR
ncbi:hypothetical protein LCGC14_1435300 [marine sediment metagenome]|uniref:Uncharacterized protein n=1 Tax=marine sediment metagenome TaxID=412755 RepID=A0A0F9JMB0_9ZZZZ